MKHTLKSTLCIFMLLLASASQVFCQQSAFNKVNPNEVETFAVGGITQDLNGFMWFTTKNGLYCYDGYKYVTYKNNLLDPKSLASDTLERISADATGKIWIGTLKGLDCFDPETDQFKHYSHNPGNPGSISADWINAILVDHEGTLWIGTSEGLDRYDRQTDSFIHYRNNPDDPSSLSYNEVVTIYADKKNTIWVGTGSVYGDEKDKTESGGLNRLNKETGTFSRFVHDKHNPNSLISNKVSAIFEDSQGNFWIGTAGDGLHIMEREKGTFIRHGYDPENTEKLSRPPLSEVNQQFDFITFIKEDAAGTIWIGTSESGINCYNPETKTVRHFESERVPDGGFNDRNAWCAYASRDGVLWIGTFSNLFRVDPYWNEIPHYKSSTGTVCSFYEEPDGTFWILTDRELIRKNESKGTLKRDNIDKNPSSKIGDNIKLIREDRQGNIWFGSKDGLMLWNKEKESFANYKTEKENIDISGKKVWSIYDDRDSNLWIGKARGLNVLNRKTGAVTHFILYPDDTVQVGVNGVTSVYQDKTGKLWVGAWFGGGLNLFNPREKEFKNYLKGNSVASIYEDTDGILWVGCWENLFRYDRITDKFVPYADPILSSGIKRILSMVEDNRKYLWLGTANGIVRLNPQRNETFIYGEKYGISENELAWGACYKTKQGVLYFGSETGYFTINPGELAKNTIPPEILFTGFLLADQMVKPDKYGPLKERLSEAKEIRLNYNQNVFSFEFVAIDYSNPEENQHFCMLENYDPDWRKSNSERRAYYFNVPPGNYTFWVKAMSSTGAWAEKKIDVIILPPWWRTWWAYGIYGLVFIVVVFGIDRFQRQRLLKAEKERIRERELQHAKDIEKAYEKLKATQTQLIHAEKMASLGELTAGIAHEIQNPLNFVNNFSEVSAELVDEMKQELAVGSWQSAVGGQRSAVSGQQSAIEILDDIKQNLDKILHHGKRADAIVKGMLQHSRTSSGQKEPTDLNALADEYLRLSYHGLRAKDKSFNADFKTDFDINLPKVNVIPQDIGRVLLNLINNAFYAVSDRNLSASSDLTSLENKNASEAYKPTVTVSTKRTLSLQGEGWGEVLIIVQDNGNGIPDEIKDKIFQPFFTTKPTGQGTGLGLSLSYDIVKAHGGELRVETKEGEGSEFIIVIPIINA